MIKVDNIIESQAVNNEHVVIDLDDMYVMTPYEFKSMIEDYMKKNHLPTIDEYLKSATTVQKG